MIALVLAAFLGGTHGGGGGGGGGSHPAPQAHSAPAPRSAPPARPAPGFSLPHDITPHVQPAPRPVAPAQPPRAAAPARPAEPARPNEPARRQPTSPLPRYQARPAAHGPVVANPHHWSHPWQWNNGVAWVAAPIYWGGGFWGAYELGLDANQYVVEPETPGAQLLEEYDLTQTPCGPPNLVEIFGPDGSEICAFPNSLVAAGQYAIDPDTLTLVSY